MMRAVLGWIVIAGCMILLVGMAITHDGSCRGATPVPQGNELPFD